MGRMSKRVEALEKQAGVGGAEPLAVHILDEFDPLPEGVDEDDPRVMVVRLVGGMSDGKA